MAEQIASDEIAVRETVERFLAAIGRYDVDAVAEMFVDVANIGAASLVDGVWTTRTLTIDEFLTRLRNESDPTRYTEPVRDFVIHVEDGRLAFARADATVVVGGEPVRHNIDYFTLMNVEGGWQFLSASYVSKPLE